MPPKNAIRLFKFITVGTLGAASYKGAIYYHQNLYPNRTIDRYNTTEKYSGGKLVEFKQYRSRALDRLALVKTFDEKGNPTTIIQYDHDDDTRCEQEYKNGQLVKTTKYKDGDIRLVEEYKEGQISKKTKYRHTNIRSVEEFTDGRVTKLSTYDYNRLQEVTTYDKYGDVTSTTRYNKNGEIESEIKYAITQTKKVTVTRLLDYKGRNCVLDEGETTVWKSGIIYDKGKTAIKIKLFVPEDAKRLTMLNFTSKVSKARVLKIYGSEGETYNSVYVDGKTYTVNEIITCDFDDLDPNNTGISVSKFKN